MMLNPFYILTAKALYKRIENNASFGIENNKN